MHKHSEPEKEELKFKQIPTDLFEQKIAKRFFCVRFFNIPYQVCLTGTVESENFSTSMESEIFSSESEKFSYGDGNFFLWYRKNLPTPKVMVCRAHFWLCIFYFKHK